VLESDARGATVQFARGFAMSGSGPGPSLDRDNDGPEKDDRAAGILRDLREDDKTLADADQTQADRDQTASEADQKAADDDQFAADDDQAASDLDLANGGDPNVHRASSLARVRSSERRAFSNELRSDSDDVREAAARARDLAAEARDRVSAMLDRDLEALDAEWSSGGETGMGAVARGRGETDGDRMVRARSAAIEARARAASDRREAAEHRHRAAQDRERSRDEHVALRGLLAAAELDPLTGAAARAPGLLGLEHEIDRARRTSGLLAIAFVDVIGLERVNETAGHAAGDVLLQSVVALLRRHLRSHDAIVRIGGDKFVCVMSGAAVGVARRRFDAIQASSMDAGCGIEFGIAELRAEDDVESLIGRADRAIAPRWAESPPE
jgi:diguanylate cyclase (GGDEF)-like protein